ncbi:MAG: glycosyltransferase [Eubacteriales bacterium]|jgi:glycosyltransferase involved in cell wall biosynthesis|nr:glycosyltransferase [Bacillota bacterium]MBV1727621.1 glycosyltransferase [Desulforudis sp.]MDQ7790389.1 glycosyltransferase [Clostridia bacterium]MDZ4044118.1 glycosyltransferase [Eubacteriales bacterium]MBU4534215.1 glycosyltransferase [Bacillota bacterium]
MGIQIQEFADGDATWLRRTYGIPDEEKIILCVARLGREKNLDIVLQAFRSIRQTHPDSKLVIVGS